MKENSGNTDRMIEEVVRIAHALDGQQESDFDKTGDRLRDAIGRIANQVEHGGGGGGSLPDIQPANKGMFLHVNESTGNAEWANDDGGTLPKVIVVLHSAYTPSGAVYQFRLKGSVTALTYEELSGLIRNSGIKLIGHTEYVSEADMLYNHFDHSQDSSGENILFTYRTRQSPMDQYVIKWNESTNVITMGPYTGYGRYWVTLTLTSEDGGTMNHTNKEIAEAFNNGGDVWFQGNMNGMNGKFPLKAITYLTGMQYPFIEAEFDYVDMHHSTGIISTAKTIIAISAHSEEHNVFWMKQYTLDS